MSSMGPVESFPFTAMCGLFGTADTTYTGPPAVTSFHGTTWKPPLVSDPPWTSQGDFFTSFWPIATGLSNETGGDFVAQIEGVIALVHKKDDKKSDAAALKGFQPTVFGIVSSMPFAAAIASVLAGIFVL